LINVAVAQITAARCNLRSVSELEDSIPVPLVEVAANGSRRQYEFEQILRGGRDDPGADGRVLDDDH
jgi:hypothetical protein